MLEPDINVNEKGVIVRIGNHVFDKRTKITQSITAIVVSKQHGLVLRPAGVEGRFVAGGKLRGLLFPARRNLNNRDCYRCLNLDISIHVGASGRERYKSDGQESVNHCVTSLLVLSLKRYCL